MPLAARCSTGMTVSRSDSSVSRTVVDERAVGGLTASSTTVRETEESLRETVMPVLQRAASGIAAAYRNANPQIFRSR